METSTATVGTADGFPTQSNFTPIILARNGKHFVASLKEKEGDTVKLASKEPTY